MEPNELKRAPFKFEFNTATFFTAAKDFCVNALDGDWGTAANTAFIALKDGLTNDTSAEHKAKLLIHNTLVETVVAVLSDKSIHRNIVNKLADDTTRKKKYSAALPILKI